tara:strand:- start:218 stop:1429 length:1212 start_codon:yes stop_codon:yes gene_type:complete
VIWNTAKLGDVCFIQSGNSIAAKKKTELFTNVVGTPYIATKDVDFNGSINYKNGIYIPQEYVNSFKISQSGSTLVCAEGGSAGRKIAFSMNDCCFGNKLFSITPNNSLDAKYIYYYTLNEEFQSQFKAALHGLIGGVSLKKIKEFTISIPPLAEQQRIVTKLDTAFAEIDRAIISSASKETEIQKLKTSLLRSSLNGDDIMWKKVKISDVCQIQPKKAQVKLKLKDSDEVSFMPMKDLGIQTIYPKSNQIKKLEKVYSSYTYFEDNDILLAKITPCFENGKLGIASNLINGVGFGSSEYIVLRCSEEVIPQYIYFCLNQPNFRIIGENQMSGAVGHKRVPIEYVENTEIYLPPIADQERIVAKLDAANTEFRNANEAIAKSKVNYLALKSAILSQELKSNEAA